MTFPEFLDTMNMKEDDPSQEALIRIARAVWEAAGGESRCKNCIYYEDVESVSRKVCTELDDKFTQHYGGYFLPRDEEFFCSEHVRDWDIK